jgi:hypothetical protein
MMTIELVSMDTIASCVGLGWLQKSWRGELNKLICR